MKTGMKNSLSNKKALLITITFMLLSDNLLAQVHIQAVVKDAKTNQVVPFCGIGIKNTTNGTIANGEGIFTLVADTLKDIFVITSLGYETQEISAHNTFTKGIIYLEKSNISLNEVTIHATNDYLYEIMDKCRKNIAEYEPKSTTKAYLGIETQAKEKPIELLEIYYNGYLNGINIDELLIKNGRVAWDTVNGHYFSSLSTSEMLRKVQLTRANGSFAAIPLQFKLKNMRKLFDLQLIGANKDYFHIGFTPFRDSSLYFSGEAWIDKSYNLLKIMLEGKNIRLYPLMAIFPGDSLYQFNIQITETFKQIENIFLLDYIDFRYDFIYEAIGNDPFIAERNQNPIQYKTKGILYFYDYGNPFILPHFEYDPTYNDYKIMSQIPYNNIFWNNNNKVPLTEGQKHDLNDLIENGISQNYNKAYAIGGENSYWDTINPALNYHQYYNIFWSKNHRLNIVKSIDDTEEISVMGALPSQLYKLKVQLLFDITRVGDSLYHSSYTVFDRQQSFYHLAKYPYSNCFLNIYFDICEIERRKMEAQLPLVNYDLDKMNTMYEQTQIDLKEISNRYFNEVFLGKNSRELEKWNNYVKDHLGIDNIKIYSGEMKE
jgi:hypothetical protein